MAPNALRAVEERHIFSGQPEVGFSRTRKWLVFTVKTHRPMSLPAQKNYSLKCTFRGVINAAEGDFRVRENDGLHGENYPRAHAGSFRFGNLCGGSAGILP